MITVFEIPSLTHVTCDVLLISKEDKYLKKKITTEEMQSSKTFGTYVEKFKF